MRIFQRGGTGFHREIDGNAQNATIGLMLRIGRDANHIVRIVDHMMGDDAQYVELNMTMCGILKNWRKHKSD